MDSVSRSGVLRAFRTVPRVLPILPATLLMAGFFLLPIIWALYTSMTNLGLSGSSARNPQFIGLENYAYLFTDPRTWDAIGRTAIFVGLCVAGQNVVGFAIAYVRQLARPLVQNLVSTIVIVAWVIPEVVAGFLWQTFLRGDASGMNQLLGTLGMGSQQWLLSDPLAALIVINVWRGCAFSMLIYGAALLDVPKEVIEASEIDGAGPWRRIFGIILPIIRPVIATNTVLTTLNTLGVFGIIWIITAGGPGARSETLPVLMYAQAYNFGLIGYGSAIATVLVVLGVVASLVYVRLFRAMENKNA